MNLKETPRTWQLAILIIVFVALTLLLGQLCTIIWDAIGGGFKSLVVMLAIAAIIVAGLLWLCNKVQRSGVIAPEYVQVFKGCLGTVLVFFIIGACVYSVQQYNYLQGLQERQKKKEQSVQKPVASNFSDHRGDFVCVCVDSLNLSRFNDNYLTKLKSQQGKKPNHLLLPDSPYRERIVNLIGKEKFAVLFTYTSIQPIKIIDDWLICEWAGDSGNDSLCFTFFLNTIQNLMFGQVQVGLSEYGNYQGYDKIYVEHSGADDYETISKLQTLPENIKQLIIPTLIPFDEVL